MVQKFLPEIALGDKRVLVIGGKPVPFCLARIPQGGEVRGNLAAGGKGVAQPLSARDREIGEALGPILMARGLLLAGVDVIGDCVTEINVTSPTCFQEIYNQSGFDVAATFVNALEAAYKRGLLKSRGPHEAAFLVFSLVAAVATGVSAQTLTGVNWIRSRHGRSKRDSRHFAGR